MPKVVYLQTAYTDSPPSSSAVYMRLERKGGPELHNIKRYATVEIWHTVNVELRVVRRFFMLKHCRKCLLLVQDVTFYYFSRLEGFHRV